jgi:hypothetical protein
VDSVEQPQRQDLLTVDSVDKRGTALRALAVPPETMYEVAQTPEQQLATLRQAIEYQATLTKTGKPRARGRKAA